MTILHAELYDALLAAQVPDDKARAAASTLPSTNQIVKPEDLKEFSTKEDLRRFATKEDLQPLKATLERLMTKEDLYNMESRLLTKMCIGCLVMTAAFFVCLYLILQVPV